MIISSPSYQDLEAFTWDSFKNTPHYGMQDEWRFPWYTYDE